MTQLFRSLIFVPGNNSRFLEKAKKLQADIVCFDLEDSVPDNEKVNARKLIKSALKTTPNNIAYLDSLAWGYYKLGECKKALGIMEKIVKVTGLNDSEIKFHWEKIKNCKTNKKGKK